MKNQIVRKSIKSNTYNMKTFIFRATTNSREFKLKNLYNYVSLYANIDKIMYYPNPTIDDVNVHISGMDKKVMINIFSEKGDLVYRKEQQVQDLSRLTEIDLSLQSTGTYIVVMEGKTVRKTFKIVKK